MKNKKATVPKKPERRFRGHRKRAELQGVTHRHRHRHPHADHHRGGTDRGDHRDAAHLPQPRETDHQRSDEGLRTLPAVVVGVPTAPNVGATTLSVSAIKMR